MKRILLTGVVWLMLAGFACAANNIWDNSDADNDGNVAANWSLGWVPKAGDVAYYDNTSDTNCTFSGNITCDGINATAAYSGNIDLGAGDFVIGSDGVILDHTGDLDWGTGTLGITGGDLDFVDVGGTLTMGTLGITLNGAGDLMIQNNAHLYDLTIANAATITVPVGASANLYVDNDMKVYGSLSIGIDEAVYMYRTGSLQLYSTGTITGAGQYGIYQPNSGKGLTVFQVGGTLDVAEFICVANHADAVWAAGTFGSALTEFQNPVTGASIKFQNALYTFEGNLEFSNGQNGVDLTLSNTTNVPTIIVEGDLIFDLDGTGDIVIDNSGEAVDWTLEGDVIYTQSSTGELVWTAGSGTITLSGAAAQDINFGTAVALEEIEMDKAGNGVTLTGDLDGTILTLTDGDFDAATFDVDMSGDVICDNADTLDLGSGTWTIGGDFDYKDVTTLDRGLSTVVMTGTADLIVKNITNLYKLTVDAGAVVTVPATSGAFLYIANDLAVNGTLSIAASKRVYILSASSTLAVGNSGVVTGDGMLRILGFGSLTTQDGTVNVAQLSLYRPTTSMVIAPATYDSALVKGQVAAAVAATLRLSSGTYTFNGDFELECTDAGGSLTLDNATNNPNIEFGGDVLLDEQAGTITWTKGTGTVTVQTTEALKNGGGFTFDGVADDVDVNAQVHDFSTPFTIAAWIRIPSVASVRNRIIFSTGANTQFLIHLDSRMYYITGGDFICTATELFTVGTWHHVMVVNDGTDIKLYVDNIERATETKAAANTAVDAHVGSYYGGTSWFDGQISDVRVWSTNLSSGNRATLYNSGDGTTDAVDAANCVLWYKMDEYAANTTVVDGGTGGNNGTSVRNTNVIRADYDQTLDFNGETIEDLVIATEVGTAQFTGTATFDTYQQDTGTVDYNGQTLESTGNWTIETGCSLADPNGSAITVGDTFEAHGAAGSLLNLDGSSGWTLNVTGLGFMRYCQVQNCDASGGSTIYATRSLNEGSNTGFDWTFVLMPYLWGMGP